MFKVMIVDDTEILRRDIKRLKLWGENSGFIITEEAKDGLEALKKLEDNHIDLVITDIRMPIMDGIELLRNIYEKKLCPFTILLSDYTEYNYARQGFMYGAYDYIGKPVNEKELIGLLKKISHQLIEKQHETHKINQLQGIVKDAYSPVAYINQIVEMICGGNSKASELTINMVDTIGAHFNYDKSKASLVLKNALEEIVSVTIKNHQWLTTYTEVSSLGIIDFDSCNDWNETKATVIETVEKLIFTIISFIGCDNTNDTVNQACKYVLHHINEELSVKVLSEKLFISKSYLSDIFKKQFGISLLEYINMVKMERAKKMLKEVNLKNYEIANELGFQDSEYFSKVFKKYTGMTLSDFRQKGTVNL